MHPAYSLESLVICDIFGVSNGGDYIIVVLLLDVSLCIVSMCVWHGFVCLEPCPMCATLNSGKNNGSHTSTENCPNRLDEKRVENARVSIHDIHLKLPVLNFELH